VAGQKRLGAAYIAGAAGKKGGQDPNACDVGSVTDIAHCSMWSMHARALGLPDAAQVSRPVCSSECMAPAAIAVARRGAGAGHTEGLMM